MNNKKKGRNKHILSQFNEKKVTFNDASNEVFSSRPFSNKDLRVDYQTSSPLNKTVGKYIFNLK